MKCVQSVVNAKIVRVPDDKAERMVASKSWFYIPKWQYKGKEPVYDDIDCHPDYDADTDSIRVEPELRNPTGELI